MNPYRGTIAPGNLERLLVRLRDREADREKMALGVKSPETRTRWLLLAVEVRTLIRMIERERDEELERILDEEDEERAARGGEEVREG